MARSDEHNFVTDTFITIADELSRSELYGYGEADRGIFDFACTLTTNNERQLIGQTLTHHAAGIDKDLASLLHSPDRNLPVYLYSFDARNDGRVQEFLHRAQTTIPDRVSLLRLFRYPSFDADVEEERIAVADSLRRQILDDLVMNVLFGRLQALDISLLLQATGISGLLLAALEHIALNGFFNFPALGRALAANPTTLRPRVQALLTAGMLATMPDASIFKATPRAGILLRICSLLKSRAEISSELAFILDRLGLDKSRHHPEMPDDLADLIKVPFSSSGKRIRLLWEIDAATHFGATFPSSGYQVVDPNSVSSWVGR